jgi:hypothetical protein
VFRITLKAFTKKAVVVRLLAVAAKLVVDPTDPASLSDIPAKYLASFSNPDAAGEIVVAQRHNL